MNNKRKKRANKRKHLQKQTREQRTAKTNNATPAIELVKSIVNILKPYELSASQRLKTYQLMLQDDAVYSAFSTNSVFIGESFSNARITCNTNSEASVKAKEFLEWNLANLDGQTLRSFAASAAEFKKDALAPFVKVFDNAAEEDEWQLTPDGNPIWKLSKLVYINPLTLDQAQPFSIVDGGRKIEAMRQSINALQNSQSQNFYNKRYTDGIISVPRNKLLLISNSANDSQPFGSTPFDAAYTAWKEKLFLQESTITGVAKDFSGTPVLYIPNDILAKAAAEPASDEGVMVNQLQEAMAAMHSGDQTNMIMPSDTINETGGSGHRQYEIRFLGVEGSGKQWDTVALVEQRKKAIYNVFGAANLIASDSAGGYNQLDGQMSIHAKFVSNDCAIIAEAFNNDVIPQLFRLNEWKISKADMPRLVAGDVSSVSIDEYGKFIQRVGAIGMLPKTPEVVNNILQKAEIDYRVPLTTSQEELAKLLGEDQSAAGEGMKEGLNSGTGKNTGSSGNSSDKNSDNAS